MSVGAPWSVKGIDPKAREVAKDLARRSGMTLGEWLNRVILEDDVPEDVTSEDHFSDRPHRGVSELPRPRLVAGGPTPRDDDLSRVAYALDRLTDRIEAAETRTGLAVSGVEHSVRAAVARIEAAERDHVAVASRFEGAVDRVGSEQARLAERLRRMESETSGPRSAEALRALEQSVSRVAGHVYDGETRTSEALAAMETRLARAEALAGGDPAALIDEVVGRLGQRLADAESRTALALEGLRGSLATLDGRLRSVEDGGGPDLDHRLASIADGLTRRVEDARQEIADKLKATSAGRVDERFAELAAQVTAAEQRSAQAIERMGREVLSVAETLNRRVQTSERRSAEAIAQVGGEMARIAGAVETRLGRAEQAQADALSKLGAEIGRITERLTERMLSSERRAAQAIDDVGEQVARVTERIEQRHERAADDMAERLRQSEERTARLLEGVRDRLGIAAAPSETSVADAPLKSTAAFGPELFSRAERDEDYEAPPARLIADDDFDDADDFAPIPEPDDDIFGLDQPEPPAADGGAPLSTREVIEQARATARAASPERPRLQAKASFKPTPKPASGLFAGLRTRRAPNTTLQTALMVAGGAAFLSVGAAGMVLMSGARTEGVEGSPFGVPPRAAIAIAPQAIGPLAAEESAPVEAPAVQTPAAPAVPLASQYVEAVRAVEAGRPGALARLRTIAEGGYTPAQFYLGKLYESGDAGVARNLGEARRWTALAAEGGDRSAMHNLALYYFEGQGGPQDLAGAATWFRKAAERGVVDSQYNLGLLYQAGSGVERNLATAYKWFAIAANGGDAQARSSAVDLEAKLSPAVLAAADREAQAFRPTLPRTAQASVPAQVSVGAAQRILGRLGYYEGPADGTASSAFTVAVAAYQRDHGLAATGALDPNTAARLSVFTR